MKRILLVLTLITLGVTGCFSSESQAETAAKSAAKTFVEGKDYAEIFPAMNTDVAEAKVEVVELFWLGCPHCYTLEPEVREYLKSKPDYVEFKQVPAVLNPQWAHHAKAFYTGKLLDPNNSKNLTHELFNEIHKNRNYMEDVDAVKKFFVAQGYSETQFNNTWNSMALSAAMNQAETISKGSQADSVPTFIVNGKFRTSPSMANGEDRLFKVINMLTAQENKGE